MKGRLLIMFVALAMAAVACAGPDLVGGDDATQEDESVTDEAVSGDASDGENPTEGSSATGPGAVSDDSLASEGAADVEPAADQDDQTTPTLVTTTTVQKTTPSTAAAAPPPEGTVPPAVATSDFVGIAKADLATRLGIDVDSIAVVSVQEVDWPDSSIGCPQPDMVYSQVITNGSRIILSYNGISYSYHSAGMGDPFYCENPSDPVPGSEV